MGRMIKDVLLFCTDVVTRRPHKVDKLMELLNLDSQELLTNDNLQEITSLLKDHYDLLQRFGTIFLPENYRLQPWKDLADGRVYCMLIKGEAMYKLTTLDEELLQFNAMEAAKRHEEEEQRDKKKRKLIVPIDDDTPEKNVVILGGPVATETNGTNAREKNKKSLGRSGSRTRPQTTIDDDTPDKNVVILGGPVATKTNGTNARGKNTKSLERSGSRSRPQTAKFKLAIHFLSHLSRDELQEFLHHKGVITDGFSTEAMVTIIVEDCKISVSSPFEVLPTFLKNLKNR